MAKQDVFFHDIFTPEALAYYHKNPVRLVETIVFPEGTDYKVHGEQGQILESIFDVKRTTVKSGKGIGKSAAVSWAVYCFLCCYPNPKVIITAPTFPQIESVLWPELAKWRELSVPLNAIFTQTSKKLYLTEKGGDVWFALPRVAAKGKEESMAGLHEDNMLLICDEASAAEDTILEKLLNTMTKPNNKIVLISNPTRTSGIFFDSHNKFKNNWRTLSFSALDSDNVTDNEHIDYIRERYGTDHDIWRVEVLGEFPTGSPDCVIPYEKAKQAEMQDIDPEGPIQIGADIARFGDDQTVLTVRWGYKVYPQIKIEKNTIPEATSAILDLVEQVRAGQIDPRCKGYKDKIKVVVDDTGLGAGVSDELAMDREHNIEVVRVNFGGEAEDLRYENYATTMWFNVADMIEFLDLPSDNFLIEELTSRKYEYTEKQKKKIQRKKDYKKEFKRSPDRADSLVLAFANKSNEARIIKDFDPLDKSIVRPPNVIEYIKNCPERYCSVFHAQDLFSSILYTVWMSNRLHVLDEYVGNENAEMVANLVRMHGPQRKILGNKLMFNKQKDGVADRMMNGGIFVQENYRYDEYGAINHLNNLMTSKRIVISERCQQLINQLKNWSHNDGIGTAKTSDYGLCMALANLVSDMRNNGVLAPPKVDHFIPYTGQKEAHIHDFAKTLKKKKSGNSFLYL